MKLYKFEQYDNRKKKNEKQLCNDAIRSEINAYVCVHISKS